MAWDLFQQGGIIMYPLFVCSVLALGIAIERAFSLRRQRIIRPEIVSVIENISGPEDVGLAHSICGRFEGFDERLFEARPEIEEVSLADIVLSITDPMKYHKANVDGTVALLEE